MAESLYQRYAMWCDKSGERKDPKKAFVARLEERGFERRRETAGVNKGRYIWLGIGFRSGDEAPEDDDVGSPGEPKDAHGSPGESREDKPDSSGSGGGGEPSEVKNQYLPYVNPRVEKDVDSGFTGFTGFTPERERQLSDFLDSPPDWFRTQADKHLENPTERTLNPLCTAVAARLYGDPARWREVKPAVSDWLGKVSA